MLVPWCTVSPMWLSRVLKLNVLMPMHRLLCQVLAELRVLDAVKDAKLAFREVGTFMPLRTTETQSVLAAIQVRHA